jgi:ABC-2 type transport system permease protein
MLRYLRLYRAFVVNNMSRTMEFRAQFFAGIVGYAIWSGISLLFIERVFHYVGAVRGWTRAEMWVLLGTFIILESLCYGLLGPNMMRFSGAVQQGSLDITLTKPVNTQFFVSTRYMDINGILNGVVGIALLLVGLRMLGRIPVWHQWASWLMLLTCGLVMAYSIWFFCVTWSIWAVKLEAIAVVFDPMMQMARFPLEIYPMRLRTLLTFVLPVGFLTTFPAQALLGQAPAQTLFIAPLLAAAMLSISHFFFQFALRSYGSASS